MWWLAALAACLLAAACRDAPEGGARSSATLAPPFARAGARQDLLCGLARAARGPTAGDAPCTCDDVPATGGCGHVALGFDRRRALLIEPGQTLSLPLDGGAAQAFRFSAGAPAGSGSAALALRVTVNGADGAELGSWQRDVRASGGWTDASIALGAPAASLTVAVAPSSAPGAKVALALPRLVTPTATGSPGPTNVVVYLIDTLRADHTSAYGYARDTTPHLARLAAGGMRFDLAYSTAARTRPATASLLTALYPGYHGAHSGLALSPQVTTLAERFHAAGWSTWAFVTNGHVFGNGLNFEQGFDRFQAVPGSRQAHHARTEEVNEVLFPHLDAVADEPFLLYVHALDPHAPYDPPPGYAGRFTDPAYAGPVRPDQTTTEYLNRLDIGERDLAHVVGLYDEDILYQDAMFGLLLERLEKLGVRERTIVVVVSDHGEEFREHGSWAHGGRLFEEQTHVPLVIQVPGVDAFAGRTVQTPVQIVDVMPTLLTWFGIDGAAACQGRDLTPLLGEAAAAPAPAERPIYAEETTYTAGAELKSVRLGSWKFIRTAVGEELSEANLLFDLAADPGESRNLARTQRRKLWEMNRQLAAQEASWAKSFRVAHGTPEQLDDRTRKQLEALGYLMP